MAEGKTRELIHAHNEELTNRADYYCRAIIIFLPFEKSGVNCGAVSGSFLPERCLSDAAGSLEIIEERRNKSSILLGGIRAGGRWQVISSTARNSPSKRGRNLL